MPLSKETHQSFLSAQEADSKFDYFLAGITGAVLAYFVKDFAPQRLGANQSTIEIVGLLVIILSFYLSLMRIESSILIRRTQTRISEQSDKVAQTSKVLMEGKPAFESNSGRVIGLEELTRLKERSKGEKKFAVELFKNEEGRAKTIYDWRNRTLIFGFLILLLARVLGPYLVVV